MKKHAYLIILLFILCLPLVFGATIDACQTISIPGTYDLNQSVMSNSTCFTINAANVLLRCKGYGITYDTDGSSTSGNPEVGIFLNATDSVSVQGCLIQDGKDVGDNAYGLYLKDASNNNIQRNTIRTDGGATGRFNYGIFLEGDSSFNLFRGNDVVTKGAGTDYAVYLYDIFSQAEGNTIVKNRIHANSSGANSNGVAIEFSSANEVMSNRIVTEGGDRNPGVYIFESDGNEVTYNTIATSGGRSNYGVYVSSHADQNTVSFNNIHTGGNAQGNSSWLAGNVGVFLSTHSENNRVEENTITTTGNALGNSGVALAEEAHNNLVQGNTIQTEGDQAHGIVIGGSFFTSPFSRFANNNLIINNRIATSNQSSYAMYSEGWDNSFSGNTLDNPGQWIFLDSITLNTFTDTVFETPEGSINLSFSSVVDDITKSKLGITQNRAFLNHSALPLLNQQATITLTDVVVTLPQPEVDYTDSGNFVSCTSPQCTGLVRQGNDHTFSVASFSSYRIGELQICGVCGDANQDGLVDTNDALAAARFGAGLTGLPSPGFECADVDNNAVVNILDALRIAQSAAGYPVTVSCR